MLYRFCERVDGAEVVSSEGVIAESGSKTSLNVTLEAIHVGLTRNYTRYSSQELAAAVHTWTEPYERPVLINHNDALGEPIGRVKEATFGPSVKTNGECITLKAVIVDPDAVEKVKDKRYLTVSIGGTAEKAICSICGVDRTEQWCDHVRGKSYDGKICYIDLQGITFDEVSFVNVPADSIAGIIGVEEAAGDAQSAQLLETVVGEATSGEDPNRPKGKDGKPIGKMKTGNQKQAYYGWAE